MSLPARSFLRWLQSSSFPFLEVSRKLYFFLLSATTSGMVSWRQTLQDLGAPPVYFEGRRESLFPTSHFSLPQQHVAQLLGSTALFVPWHDTPYSGWLVAQTTAYQRVMKSTVITSQLWFEPSHRRDIRAEI